VAASAGFYETTDSGKTWELAVTVPEDYVLNMHSGAAFDPTHDVFYLANANRPLARFARSAAPDYVWPPVATNDVPGSPAAARARLVEVAPTGKIRCMVSQAVDFCGDYCYVSGEDGIIVFKRDKQTGRMSFVKQIAEPRSGGFALKAAGGRLYGVTPHNGYRRMSWHGLAWFDIDPTTGVPTRKGIVECPASRQIVAGPEQKDLYLKSWGGAEERIFWYRIEADGKPARAGEVSGRGIGASSHGQYPCILQLTPDGRNLYSISSKDYAIACVARKPDGSVTYQGAVDLNPVAPPDPVNERYRWVALGVSPDGKWVYASVRNGKPTDNAYGIFKRDAETGALTFRERFAGEQDRLADMRAWNLAFLPDGTGGVLGSMAGPMLSFTYNPQDGHLTGPTVVAGTGWHPSSQLAVDSENGIMCGGGNEFGYAGDNIVVVKTAGKRQ
jgi:hypothetical protein